MMRSTQNSMDHRDDDDGAAAALAFSSSSRQQQRWSLEDNATEGGGESATPTEAPTAWTQTEAGWAEDHGVGFQSDWGPSYASSMTYDFTRHAIYLTGINYKKGRLVDKRTSSCFLGHVPLMHLHNWKTVVEPPGGDPKIEEQAEDEVLACTAMALNDDENHLWIAGMDERSANLRDSPQKTFLTAYSRDRQHVDWDIVLQAFAPVDPAATPVAKPEDEIKVQLPQALLVVPETRQILTAQISSRDATITPAYYKAEDHLDYPNTLNGGGLLLKRGMDYFATFQWFEYDEKMTKLTFKSKVDIQSDQDVFVSGLVLAGPKEEWIVMVGSLTGEANAAGLTKPERPAAAAAVVATPPPSTINPVEETGAPEAAAGTTPTSAPAPLTYDDWDGFIVVLTRVDGKLTTSKLRWDSWDHQDEWIHNVCASPEGDAIYIVGSTSGHLNPTNTKSGDNNNLPRTDAFVAKLAVGDKAVLTTEWTRQLHVVVPLTNEDGRMVTPRAEAFSCHVIPHNSDVLYVGGTVFDGASLSTTGLTGVQEVHSHGGDDVFVAQLDASDGMVHWLHQVGSSGDDTLARNNGLFADAEGDAVIYGDTTGPLYRPRNEDETHSDVFVMKFEYDTGQYALTMEEYGSSIKSAGHLSVVFIALVVCGLLGAAYWYWSTHLGYVGWWNLTVAFNKYRRRALKKDDYTDDHHHDDVMMEDDDDDDDSGNHNGSYSDTPADAIFKSKKPFRDVVPSELKKATNTSTSGGATSRFNTKSSKPYSSDSTEPSHPNGTLEMSMMSTSSSSKTYKDDPNYRPGRMFV